MQQQTIQGQFFSFAEQLSEGQPSKQKVVNTIKTTYMLLLLFSFFVISDPQNEIVISFIRWPYLILILVSFLLLLISQILVAIVNRIHFQLMHQILIFRFIIFPILLLALAAQISTPILLPLQISIGGYAVLTVFCVAITLVAFNQYDQQKLQVNSCKISILLVLSDSIMFIVLPVKNQSYYVIVLVLWICLELVMVLSTNHILMQKISIMKKLMVSVKQFFLYLFLLTTVIYPKIEDNSLKNAIFLVSLPIILILLTYTLCQKQNIKIDENIFLVEAPFQNFTQIVYKLSQQLVLYKSNLNKKFEESFMITFIATHMNKCEVLNCGLSQNSTIQELKNCNQAANRRTIFYKVIKKLQFLFELYEQRYPNDLQLKMLLLQFYSSHLPNKLKLRQTIQKIKKHKLGFQEKLLLHRLNKKMKKIQTVELIDIIKPQDQYQNVQKIILENLTYLKEFWNVLLQEKVDINKLIAISTKLFHLKSQLELSWKKHLNEIKFVSWKVIKMYAIYRRLILHDSTKACILEDYCKIVEERIKNKYQLTYMSIETEKGLIAISLSESSLGSILSVNNQTVKLFNYSSKSQMIQLRVNDVMPIVYSILHDGILSSFLKNRYKKINQDQRLLFAKNKNGFIFPFLLQLNKMSWNTNDELIFISNVQLRKSKKAPIYCITDLEGYIQDRTSTYSWLFHKNNKREKGAVQNIQQLIPNFFQVVQEEIHTRGNKKFEFQERLVIKKKSGQIQITFSAVSLFIKNQKVGYLVQGTTIAPMFTLSQKKPIKEVLKDKGYCFYKNLFNAKQLSYEIFYQEYQQGQVSSKIDQLSIPYMNTADFNNLFAKQLFTASTEHKDYGLNIKTLRLKNNKLQLAVEEETISSYQMQSQLKEMSVLKRIQLMKEQLNVQQNKDLSIYYRIITGLTCILIITLSILVIVNTISFESQQMQQHTDIIYKSTVRKLLPQFLVYSYFPSNVTNSQAVKSAIKTELVQALVQSSVQDDKKENIMKSIYFAQANQSFYFTKDMLDFTIFDNNFNSNIFFLLYSVLTCTALYAFVLLFMFVFFKITMNNIYSIFLSISDRKLQLILLESTKLHQYLSAKSVQQDVFQVFKEQVTENEEEEFQRVKKTKTKFSSQDSKMLCQLVLPMLIVLIFGIFSSTYMTILLQKHSKIFQIWKNTEQMFPETSVIMLQQIMNQMKGANLSITNIFSSLIQKYEQEILVQQIDFSQQLISLKGDPCSNAQLSFFASMNVTKFCSKQSNAFENSLSNQLNLIYLYLTDSSVKSYEQWITLINIQYNLVKPLLQNAAQIIDNLIQQQRSTIKKNTILIIVIQIFLIIVATLYLYCYPIKNIAQELLFTKDLISIIPADRAPMPIQALATLTTQAIQFRQYR